MFDGKALAVTVPAAGGPLQALPGHLPFASRTIAGEIMIKREDGGQAVFSAGSPGVFVFFRNKASLFIPAL